MTKVTGVLGFNEMDKDGNMTHRVTSELLLGVYHPVWKNNLSKLGYELRRKLQRKELNFYCDCCGGRLYLAGKYFKEDEKRGFREQRLHLRHCSDKEQKEICVYRREEHKSETDRNRDSYVNKRESPEHFKLKAIVKDALIRTLPGSEVTLEKWIPVANTRRKPDVNISFNQDGFLPKGSEIAIEIQVSQIMMCNINRRMDIDSEGHKYTIWILDSYNSEDDGENKIYKEDIFEASGLNAFVLDEEAIHRTEETGLLHLHVWYDKYRIENGEMSKASTVDKIVSFTDLTFENDGVNYTVYYYPSLKEREECISKVKILQKDKETQLKATEQENERKRLLIEAEDKLLSIKREKEGKAYQERVIVLNQKRRCIDEFLKSIQFPNSWNGDVTNIINFSKDESSVYKDFLVQIKMVVNFSNYCWNDIVNYILFILSAPPTMVKENENVLKQLISILGSKSKMNHPVQFSISEVASQYPLLEPYILNIAANPNYVITASDLSVAKLNITKLQPADKTVGLKEELRFSYCHWSSLIFIDRICKETSKDEKDKALQILASKWMAVCVFLSLQVGFIVGFRYHNWVQFADYIKTQYPEYTSLFLQITEKRGYNLRSKTKDQGKVLKNFIKEGRATSDVDAENLIKLVLPSLFKS